MPSLTPEERDLYEKDGFFFRENVFSPAEIDALRDAAESVHAKILEAADDGGAGAIEQIDNQKFQEVLGSTIKWEWRDDLRAVRSMEPTHHLDERLARLVDDPRLWRPCADIIGSDRLSLFSDKLNVKRPGGAPFPWHQEGPYWAYGAEDLEHVVTLILYLDDATEENGCLWVIPGTHRYGALEALKDRGTLGRLYTDVERLQERPFAAALPAGSVMWFHRDLVHGSQTNRTRRDRRAFLLAYQPAGLRQWRNRQRRDVAPAGRG
jgi:ectoine hydroxylase